MTELPDDVDQLTLTSEFARSADWWGLSTDVRTTWTVPTATGADLADWLDAMADSDDRMGLADEEPDLRAAYSYPMLAVDYGIDLDEYNRGEQVETYTISVGAPGAAAVAGFSLEASFDDGATWAPVEVARAGDATFRATVHAPDGAEFVSLRSAAWDEAGGRVEETAIRALPGRRGTGTAEPEPEPEPEPER